LRENAPPRKNANILIVGLWPKFEILRFEQPSVTNQNTQQHAASRGLSVMYSHIFALINMKVGTGERTSANFHVYRGNVSPLRGENPIFGPLSKNNTVMAALRAGLPVKNITLFRLQPARNPRSTPYLAR